MFLFLSKLLPLFLYPLGLTCLLLLVAVVMWWKRPQWVILPVLLSLVLLLLGSNTFVSTALVRSLEWQNLPPTTLPHADAIVVLGGGIKPESPPRPWVDVTEAGDRIIHGARLYLTGHAPLLILSGGRVDWHGGGPPESSDMAKIARAMGVPSAAILEDPTSFNTYQNAVNVRKILTNKGINQILLVTSALHMPRSLLIFRHEGMQAIPAPTDFLIATQDLQELDNSPQYTLLNLLPDVDQLARTSKALKEYVGLFIYRLRGWL